MTTTLEKTEKTGRTPSIFASLSVAISISRHTTRRSRRPTNLL
jgi:hypothetical protein